MLKAKIFSNSESCREKMLKNYVWIMFCFMKRGLWFQFLRWEQKSRPVFGQLTRWTIWSHMHIGSVMPGHLSIVTIVHLSNGIKINGVTPLLCNSELWFTFAIHQLLMTILARIIPCTLFCDLVGFHFYVQFAENEI